MKIFTFTGWSGTGKTTLVSNLISELSGRGFRVLAVKKAPDKYHIEPEGKDSRKFLEHGAETVYLVAGRQLMKMVSISRPEDFPGFAAQDLETHDFILTEGFIHEESYLFEIYDPHIADTLKTDRKLINAIISDHPVLDNIPHFRRDEIRRIADHMESIK